MIGYRELLMQQEHARELLHQAEKERFLRQVLAGAHRNGWHGRALIWLGGHLVAWGHSLEKRYGAAAQAS